VPEGNLKPEVMVGAQPDVALLDKHARAAKRRATWLSGACSTPADKDLLEHRFWQEATPSERLDAVVQMAIDSELIQGHEPPDRLQRSLGGIRR
jgi:hypothetical protein